MRLAYLYNGSLYTGKTTPSAVRIWVNLAHSKVMTWNMKVKLFHDMKYEGKAISTHWGSDKMATRLQMKFSTEGKCINFYKNVTEFFSYGSSYD